jgi:hypothetical protein
MSSLIVPTLGLVTKPSQVAKLIGYMAGAVIAVLIPALKTEGGIQDHTLVNAGIAVVGVVAVYYASKSGYGKTITAAILAGLQALVLILAPGLGFGDVTAADWLGVILAALTAAGVWAIPNAPLTPARQNADGSYIITTADTSTMQLTGDLKLEV